MRLWHCELIPVLPNEMLVAEWRECIAIKRQWEKGTLKHRLVSYVMDYNKGCFYKYVGYICDEMIKRDIKYKGRYFNEICYFCGIDIFNVGFWDFVEYKEHNDRYLKQCLYNLQEKTDRGIVSKEDWKRIEERFGEYL